MVHRSAIYRAGATTCRSDTCKPLVTAVRDGKVALEALARGSYPGRKLARGVLPGLSSVGYWNATGKQDWGLDWHRNEGIELTFLETGRMPFAVDGKEYTLGAGDVTITRPWQQHRVGLPHVGPGRLHWMILDVGVRRPNQPWNWPDWMVLTRKDLKELTITLRHNEQPVWRATREIRHCFGQIGCSVQNDRNGSSASRLTAYLNELMVLLLEMLRLRQAKLDKSLSSTRRTVELFLEDLRFNPDSVRHPWTLEEMAEQCGLGLTYFVHHCKQITNMTPTQYLNQCRVEMAIRMLKDKPGQRITDIAIRCGFSSSQYFATVFRQHTGCSPLSFHKANR